MGEWDAWVGRTERKTDRVDPGLAARWLATLDRDAGNGDNVPQGLHWCLCMPDTPTAQLGPDGHPVRNDSLDSFLPPVPLPRRMWASSKIEFRKPLRVGEAVERISTVTAVSDKTGSSGRLVFVDIAHETHGKRGLAVREVQTVVYRNVAETGAPLVPPVLGEQAFDVAPWSAHRAITPIEPLLLRYSALTFTAHRIHYDRPYATAVEGYRGLVVHGPLTATLLLDLAQAELGDNALARFAFRGVSPAICGEALHVVMRGTDDALELGAFAADGRQVMAAQASVA